MKLKKYVFGIAILGSFLASFTVRAQNRKPCGQGDMYLKAVAAHPEILQQEETLEVFTQDYVARQKSAKMAAAPQVYVIPVVFHIIHNYGVENISDAQIYNEMVQLNNDYRKKNSDTILVVSQFDTIKADAHFEFRLAQKDPNGKCTNGIDRIASILTYNADDNSKLNQWNPAKYLNVWVVATLGGGFAGYTYLPSTAALTPQYDGVIMLSSYVGDIGTSSPATGRCLTHEIGHYFNLYHPWGKSNAPGVACGDDKVSDTPLTKGYDYCPASPAASEICTAGVVENYQNFMEYSYCSEMFTGDQVSRMRAAANSPTANRNSLWQASNLTATGVNIDSTINTLCTADFVASKVLFCEGSTTTFNDNSWNGTPTSWNWTFSGGSPSTGTASQVSVTYATAGVYDVSLTVSNGSSSPSVTKTGYITVVSTTADYLTPFTETFEKGAVPDGRWTPFNVTAENPHTWTSTSPGYNSNTSVYINNFSSDTASSSQLISQTMDLTTIKNPKLYYRVAYAQKTSTSADNLSVYVSTNCGSGYGAARLSKSGATLSTVSPVSSAFTPSSAGMWRLDSINLAPYANQHDVRIMFQFTNALGNNIYLDDINVSYSNSVTGIAEDLLRNTIDFNIYPNPIGDKSTIAFSLVNNATVSLSMFDILGKQVSRIADGERLSNGSHSYSFSGSGLSSGIYFVKLMVDDQLFVKKVIVK